MQLLEHFNELSLHPKNAKKIKGLILQLAMHGKLTSKWREENPNSPSALVLLGKIEKEKEQLIKEKKINKEKPLSQLKLAEIPYSIPESWVWSKLPVLFYGVGNKTNQLSTKEYNENGDFPIIDQGKQFIAGYSNDKTKLLNIEYPVVVFGDHTRHVKYIDFNFIIGADGTKILKPYSPIFPEFFYQQLLSYDLTNRGYGRHFKILKETPFAMPPFEEQKAIVEVVNQLFAEVDQLETLTKERIHLKEDFVTSALKQLSIGDTSTEWAFLKEHFATFFTEKSNIKKLRESILQLAVQGKLTSDWRKLNRDVENAKVLLERIKKEKEQLIKEKKIKKENPLPKISDEEIPYELPEGWVWTNIDEVCTRVTDGFHHTPKKQTEGVRYISATHIKDKGILWDECLFIGQKEHDELFKKAKQRKGDVLIVNRGAGCGTPALVNIDEPFSFQNAALIGFNLDFINSEYMCLFILKQRSEIMDFFTNGGAQPMLSNKILKTILFPLPSSKEQKAIVEKINSLMDLCDELEAEIEMSKTTQEKWMESSLREVFDADRELQN